MKYKGVYEESKKNGQIYYRASLTHKSKHISLGSYDTAIIANQAYNFAREIFENKSFSVKDYPQDCVLLFDKYIQLINYRDNGIYFSTPVYLRKSYFSYFYSPLIELKFDLDDLFYYSSHKIMKRGNHFFVADFGMQESINERYKIRPFSVIDRDYRFINNDRYDFRRENIEIINPFFGVSKTKTTPIQYTVKIHVVGDMKVGIYDNVYHAAIAYNKAADILKQNGCTKKFNQNYIEEISPREYAQIYTDVKISDNVSNYVFN